jgi:uncharacterized protein YvpB
MFIRSTEKLESLFEIATFHFLYEFEDIAVAVTGKTLIAIREYLHAGMLFTVYRTATHTVPSNLDTIFRQNIAH